MNPWRDKCSEQIMMVDPNSGNDVYFMYVIVGVFKKCSRYDLGTIKIDNTFQRFTTPIYNLYEILRIQQSFVKFIIEKSTYL